MLIQSSAMIVSSTVKSILNDCTCGTLSIEETAMDLVEYISLRLASADDITVLNLGLFIRDNLTKMRLGSIDRRRVQARIEQTALRAKLGGNEFVKSITLAA